MDRGRGGGRSSGGWWWGVLLLIVAAAAVRWGRPVRERAELLYWQRQCMNFKMPEEGSPIERDPAKGAYLAGVNNDYFLVNGESLFMPRSVRSYLRCANAHSIQSAVLYMHEMRSPGGNRRLVVIEGLWTSDRVLYVDATVCVPAGFRDDNRRIGPVNYEQMLPRLEVTALEFGKADISDPGHFTIRYESDGRGYVIDGRLNDEDCINLTSRPD